MSTFGSRHQVITFFLCVHTKSSRRAIASWKFITRLTPFARKAKYVRSVQSRYMLLHNITAFKCLRIAILPVLLLLSIDRSAAAINSRDFTEHSNSPSRAPTTIGSINPTSKKTSSHNYIIRRYDRREKRSFLHHRTCRQTRASQCIISATLPLCP